jgi:hypothetical protein
MVIAIANGVEFEVKAGDGAADKGPREEQNHLSHGGRNVGPLSGHPGVGRAVLNADGVGIGPSPGLFAEDRQRSELGRGDVRQRHSTTIRPRTPQVEDRHPARPEPGSQGEHDKDDLPACHCTHRSREGSSRGINTIR